MTAMNPVVPIPAQLESGLQQVGTLAALLRCVDLELWDSLGRPGPRGLSALLYRAHSDIESGLEELATTSAD